MLELLSPLLALLLSGEMVLSVETDVLQGGDKTDALVTEMKKKDATAADLVTEVQALAKEDHPDALHILARWNEGGTQGLRRNAQAAASLYRRASELGHLGSTNHLGVLMLAQARDAKATADAVALVKKASDGGLPLAQRNYAAFLSNGTGVEQSHEAARALLESRVAASDGDAAYLLARLWEGSNGHPVDEPKATSLLRQSAELKSPRGLQEMGLRKISGKGVPAQDISGGIGDLASASALGNVVASRELGRICESGLHGTEVNVENARAYFQLAADRGDAYALERIGFFTETGSAGVAKDPQKALNLYRQAASGGSAQAHFNVGRFYSAGAIVDAEPAKAFTHYLTAAAGGVPEAQFYVGRSYETGAGTRQDLVAAAAWYDRASRIGVVDAQLSLATFFERGLGVPANLQIAARLLGATAQRGDARGLTRMAVYYREGLAGIEKDPAKAYVLAAMAGERLPAAKEMADELKKNLSDTDITAAREALQSRPVEAPESTPVTPGGEEPPE